MNNEIQTSFETVAGEVVDTVPSVPSELALDHERYMPELADLQISEDQKRAFLTALWVAMRACVELSYKMNVVELVCGQACENCGDLPDDEVG